MIGTIRTAVWLGVAALQAVLAFGFVTRAGWATGLWPWAEGRLSYLFLGAVLAALAAGGALVVWRQSWRGALPSLIAVAALFAGLGVESARVWLTGEVAAGGLALACLATALGAVGLGADVARLPGRRQRLATLPRLSCAVFSCALIGTGAALIAGAPHVFPWPLPDQTARMFGLIFLGLSLSYGLTALWGDHASGLVALTGFLVYDLILLPPFVAQFASVAPERLTSLTLYVAVLIYSAALAVRVLIRAGMPART